MNKQLTPTDVAIARQLAVDVCYASMHVDVEPGAEDFVTKVEKLAMAVILQIRSTEHVEVERLRNLFNEFHELARPSVHSSPTAAIKLAIENGKEMERLRKELEQEKIWKVEDPRMLREQIRVGDVAFQHLFCTSKGKPLPDWCREGLPNIYRTLELLKISESTIQCFKRDVESAEAKLQMATEYLTAISRPALGGKLQQYAAQEALAKLKQ